MEGHSPRLSKQLLGDLTTYLAVKLEEGGYQLIPQNQVKERLRELQAESHKECFDMTCQIELGRELAAQKSISSQVLVIGKTCKVTATLYDLARASAGKRGTEGS